MQTIEPRQNAHRSRATRMPTRGAPEGRPLGLGGRALPVTLGKAVRAHDPCQDPRSSHAKNGARRTRRAGDTSP